MTRINLKFSAGPFGDQTCSYSVEPNIVTVRDIIWYYKERKESGIIYGLHNNVKASYGFNDSQPIPEEILSKKVYIKSAHGGWGRMDFNVIEISSDFFTENLYKNQ